MKKSKDEKVNVDKYNSVVRSIDRFNLYLNNLNLQVGSIIEQPDAFAYHVYFYSEHKEQTEPSNLRVNCFFSILAYDSNLQIKASSFNEVLESFKEYKDNYYYFEINFSMCAEYSFDLTELIPDEIIKLFADNNTPIHAWPYARELVSSLTMKMGLNHPLVLQPLIK